MNFGSIPFVARATPSGGGGSLEWVTAGSEYDGFIASTTHNISVPAGGSVGDMLVVALFPFGTISSIATNTSQSLTELAAYSSPGEVGRFWGVVTSGSWPTSITVTLATANDLKAQIFVARGVTQVAGTVLNGNEISARTNLTYNTDAADALVATLYTTTGSNSRVLSTFVPSGGSGTAYTKWAFSSYGTATGVHDGATGLNNAAVTWSESDASGGRWLSLALKA